MHTIAEIILSESDKNIEKLYRVATLQCESMEIWQTNTINYKRQVFFMNDESVIEFLIANDNALETAEIFDCYNDWNDHNDAY